LTALGSTDAECDEVFKIWRGTFVEDIVHGCSYFENDAEFYWKPVKLSEGRGDVRPTTKAENEPGGCILDPLERGEC